VQVAAVPPRGYRGRRPGEERVRQLGLVPQRHRRRRQYAQDTTLPAIDMDLCSDPDIVSVCKKSYSLEDILSRVNETDSDSADTVDSLVCLLASHTLCHGFCFTIFIRLITRALLSQGNCRMQCVFVVLRAFRKICQGHGASKAHDTHSRNCSLRVFY